MIFLEYISKNNKHRPRLVAGFSAETENLIKNSINKMKKKHCDLILLMMFHKKILVLILIIIKFQ